MPYIETESRAAAERAPGAATRVVIADDAVLLREGVARLLAEAGFEVVGQAGDADELVRKVHAHRPDVAIVDVRMPPDNSDDGLRAALTLREQVPELGILLLSQYVEERYLGQLLADRAEGVGYLLKERVAEVERLGEAVRRVAAGGSVLDPEVVTQMLGSGERGPLAALAGREREVLELIAEGRTNRSIAARLALSERSIERHVTAIFDKLGLPVTAHDHRRVLAALTYLRGQ
jgi:DNA-binding NarL/FixJ family response regulator